MNYSEKKKYIQLYGIEFIRFAGFPKPYTFSLINRNDIKPIKIEYDDKYKFELPFPKK